MISSSINDVFNSQLCSQSPYVLPFNPNKLSKNAFSMLPISFCEPNFASTQSRPSGWNCINHIYGVQVGGQALVVEQSQFEVFSADPKGFTSFRWHCQFTLSVESHANCSSLPNPKPTFPCSYGFLPSWWSWWRWSFESTSWELYYLWTIHFQ